MIRFQKWHGIGNDFVLLDARGGAPEIDFAALSVAMCHRRLGVGADGLLLLASAENHHARMRMWNPDGVEAEMCGNGVRCAGWIVGENRVGRPCSILTKAGAIVTTRLDDGAVSVDMGAANWDGVTSRPLLDASVGVDNLCGTAVSMGNPHLVMFVDDVKHVPLDEWGPILERHPAFPDRTNVHFVQVLSSTHVLQRTWERGAGMTLACGTGACAVAAVGARLGRTANAVRIDLPGGTLRIEVDQDWKVTMTGPAERTFVGWFPWDEL